MQNSQIRDRLTDLLFLGNFREFERYYRQHSRALRPEERAELLAFYYLNTLKLARLQSLMKGGKLSERTVAQILFYLGYLKEARVRFLKLLERENLGRRTEAIVTMALDQIEALRCGRPISGYVPPEEGVLREIHTYNRANFMAYTGDLDGAVRELRRAKEGAIRKGAEHLALVCHVFSAFLSGSVADLELVMDTARRLKAYRLLLRTRIFLSFLKRESPPRVPKGYRYFRYLSHMVRETNAGREPVLLRDFAGMWNVFWYVHKVRDGITYLSFSGRLSLYRGREKVKIPKHLLITLAYLKALGKEGVYEHASLIFRRASVPIKRVWNNLSALKPYAGIPTDMEIALRCGTFLSQEGEDWAEVLRERLLPH